MRRSLRNPESPGASHGSASALKLDVRTPQSATEEQSRAARRRNVGEQGRGIDDLFAELGRLSHELPYNLAHALKEFRLATSAAIQETATFLCRLCGSNALRLYYRQGNDLRFHNYKCDRCGLVNLDLATGMDQTQFTEEWVDPTDDSLAQNQLNDTTFEFIRRYLPTPGAMLDVGCCNGRLLYRARSAGWRVKGNELSAKAAAAIEAAIGIECMAGDFLTIDPPEEDRGRYDLVCLRHVLEHLPDSKGALTRIRALLKQNGMALFEMPNIEGFDKRLKRWLVNQGLHTRRFPADFMASHCNEFCRSAFEYLAKATGFKLIRWETYSNKPLVNLLYTRVHIGNKARALVQRVDADAANGAR